MKAYLLLFVTGESSQFYLGCVRITQYKFKGLMWVYMACTKTRNTETKPLKRNHRNHRTAETTESKSGERRPTKRSSVFSLQAAHSCCQWQCVVRDAIMLNYTLLEPVPSPHIHEVFCGTLAQSLHGELQKGNNF